MAIGSASGISVTDVQTTAAAPLGFEVVKAAAALSDGSYINGYQTWVYVFNDEAANGFAVGQVIYRDPSATTFDFYGGLITPATDHQAKVGVLGVAQHAIPAGSFGFILKHGVGFVKCGSVVVTADTPFTTGGDDTGCVLIYADDTAGANIGVIGHTATALVADAATVLAYVNCG